MNNFFTRFLLALAFGIGSFFAVGQPQHVSDHIKKLMPNPVPQSPNVAGLGKYGDYQVNHFTGIPDISIPIFEAKSGSLSVPITLSYHASGVKPTDVASWVGMGWSLSAGGTVAREVQGKPDEEHYFSNALIPFPTVCDPPGSVAGNFYYLQYAAGRVTDTEPDIFSYSFPGKSGKFMLPFGSAPLLFPYAPIIINAPSGFNKFEITDEQGVLHRFGQNAQSVSSTDFTFATNGGNPTVSATTAWHLMDMIAPNSNDQITFEYQQLGASPTHDISYSYTVMDECNAENGGTCPFPYFVLQQHNTNSTINQNGLKTITFENGKVVFEISSTGRNDVPAPLKRLEAIKVYSIVNGTDVLQKTIKFNYSYFKNAALGDQALKLEGIQFLDKTNTPIQNYTFDYFTNSFSWTPNGVNFLNARDLWGNYNGALGNTDLLLPRTIPFQQLAVTLPTTLSFGGAYDRNVNTQYIKEGVLKRINFPTGGYTEFDFESNKYDKGGVPTDAGGLRVTKITSSDGTSAPMVKTYKYGNAESGLGLPSFSDAEFNYNSSQLYFSDCDITSPISNYQTRTYYSRSYGQEAPIVYPYVTEYMGDWSGTTNGKTVYVYDNGNPSFDILNVMPGSTKTFKNSTAWKRGKLTSKTVYDNANRIIASTAIARTLFKDAYGFVGLGVYQFVAGNTACAPMTCFNEAVPAEPVHPQTYMFSGIYQSSGVMVETGVSEVTYQDGDINKVVVKSELKTLHPDKLQVISASTSLSATSEQQITVNRYPFEFTAVNASSTGAAKGIYKLNQKNIVSTPVETYTYVQRPGQELITSARVTTFRENSANTSQVVPDQIYLWESAVPIAKSAYVPVAINGTNSGITMDGKFAQRINMVSYDDAGNILTVAKSNDINVTYIYGYNKSLPVAEVTNALNTEVFYNGFESSPPPINVIPHTGIGCGSGSFYPPAMPGGRTYIVEYWYYESNKWNYQLLPFTNGMTLDGVIDDVRVYPKDAQMKTYTYDPILGMTSSINESGQTYKYEYDSFGRLGVVRNEKGNIEKQYSYHYKTN